MSIVIRDLVEVVDVLSSDVVDVNALLLDLPEDEPELAVVINKFFPDKFALTSLNWIGLVVVSVVVVVSSLVVYAPSSLLLLQEITERLKRDMRIIYKTLFIFFLHQ